MLWSEMIIKIALQITVSDSARLFLGMYELCWFMFVWKIYCIEKIIILNSSASHINKR